MLMGQPMTKEVAVSRVTSDTSEMQVESQTSDRGTCTGGSAGREAGKQVFQATGSLRCQRGGLGRQERFEVRRRGWRNHWDDVVGKGGGRRQRRGEEEGWRRSEVEGWRWRERQRRVDRRKNGKSGSLDPRKSMASEGLVVVLVSDVRLSMSQH